MHFGRFIARTRPSFRTPRPVMKPGCGPRQGPRRSGLRTARRGAVRRRPRRPNRCAHAWRRRRPWQANAVREGFPGGFRRAAETSKTGGFGGSFARTPKRFLRPTIVIVTSSAEYGATLGPVFASPADVRETSTRSLDSRQREVYGLRLYCPIIGLNRWFDARTARPKPLLT
jgi:hypothetical protein